MSGDAPVDVVVLQGDAAGIVAALVRAAGVVVERAGVRTAVIGGLAVTCRLATAHRATADVDLVADDPSAIVADAATAADNLVAAGVAQRASGSGGVRLSVGGTTVEIIDTEAVDADLAADIEPDRARLFVLAHRWALDSATPVRIVVAGTTAEATVPVATPAALVAMKLHAIADRSDDRKRASDAWDLYRLLDAHNRDGSLGRSFSTAPPGLAALVADGLDRVFSREATRTRRWVRVFGDPAWVGVLTEDTMADLAAELTASLGR